MHSRALLAASVALLVSFSSPTYADVPQVEVVAEFEQRPGNPSITPEGRILLSIHPLDHPALKVVELNAIGTLVPYPNESFSMGKDSEAQAVIAIRTDDNGIAWILDLGKRVLTGWDTKHDKQAKKIVLPESVLLPTSFLQDFALDQKRNRIIIADMTQGDLKSAPIPAFIVVDLVSGKAKRLAESHPSMMPDFPNGFALNPITIDPSYTWVYFGALHGKSVYRVPASSFDGDSLTVESSIEKYGPKSYSDGITVDSEQNIYITDIESNAIGVTTPEGYKLLASLDEAQSWPDGLSFGPDGYVYATVNQLNRTAALNNGVDEGVGPYQVVRVKALAKGKTGR
jgi:sugar lactone lactonase YvrE